MDTNKMREQICKGFDAWLDGYEKDREANGWMPLEPFVHRHMRNAFVASREAVVVELPPKWNDETNSNKQAWDCGIDDARMAIEDQGVKCK